MESKKRAIYGILLVGVIIFAVGTVSAESDEEERITVIITVDKGFDERSILEMGGKVIAKGRIFPIIVAEIPAKALDKIKNHSGVLKVENNIDVSLLGKKDKKSKSPKKNPSKSPKKGKGKKNQPSQPPQQVPWGINRIHAVDAWSINDGSSGGVIEVAILDTGIDYNHPDLAGNIAWAVSVINGKISENPKDYMDKNGHGTHVAGTVSALNNNIGVVGVAPNVEVYAIKCLMDNGYGKVSDIIFGIEEALLGPDGVLDKDNDGIVVGDPDDDAAEVISMSFGATMDIGALHDALIYAHSLDVVLVAAAGNYGAPSPTYPAAYDEVIAVGAIDQNDNVPLWSNRGVEVSAPGVNVLSTYPNDKYAYLSGTSMATPHVSGVVALIQAAHYSKYGDVLSSGEVRNILHSTADDLGSPGYDISYGYGVVRADLAVQQAIQ